MSGLFECFSSLFLCWRGTIKASDKNNKRIISCTFYISIEKRIFSSLDHAPSFTYQLLFVHEECAWHLRDTQHYFWLVSRYLTKEVNNGFNDSSNDFVYWNIQHSVIWDKLFITWLVLETNFDCYQFISLPISKQNGKSINILYIDWISSV